MDYSTLITDVLAILEDNLGVAFSDSQEQRAATKAVRRVANKVGRTESRQSLDLVESQQAYLVPTGIRRLKKVQLIPENGNEPNSTGLRQVGLSDIPITVPNERDPDRYSIRLDAGTDENQFEIFLWPAPARSATDAIVITYDVDVVFDGTAGQKIPYPPELQEAIVYYTASYLLFERADESDTQEAQKFKIMGDTEVKENRSVDSMSHYIDNNRAMP